MEDDGDLSSPDWLVYEVLLRLPLNCVFTCRLVSKLWLSVSSDPSFIRAYASRASSRPRWTILSSVVNFDITGRSNWRYVMPPELYLRPRVCKIGGLPGDEGRPELVLYADSGRQLLSYRIVGVSNGLVLYCPVYELSSFYICNPITGRWIRACDMERIPFPNYSMLGWGFITRIDEGEFVLKRYRIILARGNNGDALIFNVYYSEIDECKKFTVPLLLRRDRLRLQAYAAVLNGLLHWAEMDLGVIIYDPDSNPNRIRVVPRPRQVEWPHKMLSCLCLEYRGELRYIAGYSGESPGFDIWSLGDDGRWCFQHKIVIKGIVARDMGSVFFDPCDPDVVFCLINGRLIFSYNSKCGTFEKRSEMTVEKGDGRPLRWRTLSQTHRLVIPPWPIRVDEEHLERRPRVSRQANPQSGKRKAAESRILKSHPMSKSLADSGTTFEDGVRRSKRIRIRPLEYWKGERFLYGRVKDEVKLIGVNYISPGEDKSDMKVKPYVSSDNVIVKGVIDPENLASGVHKKTGKQATVVVKEEEKKGDDEKNEEKKDDEGDKKLPEGEPTKKEEEDDEDGGGKKSDIKKSEYWPPKYYMEYYYAPQIFSDENPNACSVM